MEGIVTIVGLKPETTYAVRLAALNGKAWARSAPPLSSRRSQSVSTARCPARLPGVGGPIQCSDDSVLSLQVPLLTVVPPPSSLALSGGRYHSLGPQFLKGLGDTV